MAFLLSYLLARLCSGNLFGEFPGAGRETRVAFLDSLLPAACALRCTYDTCAAVAGAWCCALSWSRVCEITVRWTIINRGDHNRSGRAGVDGREILTLHCPACFVERVHTQRGASERWPSALQIPILQQGLGETAKRRGDNPSVFSNHLGCDQQSSALCMESI